MEISVDCPRCQTRLEVTDHQAEHCGQTLFPNATDRFIEAGFLNQCPACGAAHLYRQKDFNRRLGVALVLIGITLAWWTYGISLVVVTLVDWALYRAVGEVGCCYACTTQFRGPEIAILEPFNLELNDYYRSRKGA
jgi:hypothetical protein